MNTHQAIIDYVHSVTGGIVTLLPEHASDIIKLVEKKTTAYVILLKWTARGYEKQRVISTAQHIIDEKIKEAINQAQVEKFYLFECYTATGEYQGKIYTINPNLF